jgi:AcrR family transcriptional regulator
MSRDPFSSPSVESRRDRPAKQPLSRDAIVAEALRQLMADGVMSLRKVAAALDTGPASLYAYVDDVNELHALVLDRALAEVTPGDVDGLWRERLHALLRSYRGVLAGSPGLARLALGTIAVGPNALRIAESMLGLLGEAGVEPATAAWAIDLLGLFVTAVAVEHGGGSGSAAPDGPGARAIERAIERASAGAFPHVHAARDHVLSGTGEERFTWAVDVLIHGILFASERAAPAAGDA